VRPRPNGWRPFTAVEHFTVRPAGFVWDAAIRMAPGVPVLVRDGFVAGRGSMTASVLGIRRVVSIEGTPAIASGALPVSAGGDRPALDAAYRRARGRPGDEVLVRFDGRIVRTGASRASAVLVTRFLGASRRERC
jgi:hypothetical protein